MKCSLCGFDFDEKIMPSGCDKCAIKITSTCNMARCPNCGFEMPKESQMGRLLKKLRRGKDE